MKDPLPLPSTLLSFASPPQRPPGPPLQTAVCSGVEDVLMLMLSMAVLQLLLLAGRSATACAASSVEAVAMVVVLQLVLLVGLALQLRAAERVASEILGAPEHGRTGVWIGFAICKGLLTYLVFSTGFWEPWSASVYVCVCVCVCVRVCRVSVCVCV